MQNQLSTIPDAFAIIKGSHDYPSIRGKVFFYNVHGGTIVTVKINGLPENNASDLPVLMGNKGLAWCKFYTDRFYPEDVVGKTVIIHDMPDDFRSQPSGDSGMKIACGVIEQ